MSLVIDLIDLVAKHKAGELRCPATALIKIYFDHKTYLLTDFQNFHDILKLLDITSFFHNFFNTLLKLLVEGHIMASGH